MALLRSLSGDYGVGGRSPLARVGPQLPDEPGARGVNLVEENEAQLAPTPQMPALPSPPLTDLSTPRLSLNNYLPKLCTAFPPTLFAMALAGAMRARRLIFFHCQTSSEYSFNQRMSSPLPELGRPCAKRSSGLSTVNVSSLCRSSILLAWIRQ